MPEHRKDVMIYHYDPKKRYFLVTMRLENKPGALGNVANMLAIRGINLMEGYLSGTSSEEYQVASFFLESTNPRLDTGWLKEFIESSVFVSDVMVKQGVEGFLFDSLNFPLSWNTGDRAVLVKVEGLRAMLNAMIMANPAKGAETIYSQGFNYGKLVWEQLLSVYRPQTREGLSEALTFASELEDFVRILRTTRRKSCRDPKARSAKLPESSPIPIEPAISTAILNACLPQKNHLESGGHEGRLTVYLGALQLKPGRCLPQLIRLRTPVEAYRSANHDPQRPASPNRRSG
jgi:hypothetical protein